MTEKQLDTLLTDVKFIVIADAVSRKPIQIYFDWNLPNLHSEIFDAAKQEYSEKKKDICVQGGGRITKRKNFIVFHGTSQKYKRYEDEIVLLLAKDHPLFRDRKYIFLSKAGEEDVNKIIENHKQ